MINCHSHFYFQHFTEQELPTLAAVAREAGVRAIVVAPESLQDCRQVCVISTTVEQRDGIASPLPAWRTALVLQHPFAPSVYNTTHSTCLQRTGLSYAFLNSKTQQLL